MEKTKLLNTYVNNVTLKEAVEFLLQKIRQQTPAYVVEVNVDVVVKMEQDTKEGRSVFVLGGKEDAAHKAAENIKARYPGLVVAGALSPSMGFEKKPEEVAYIRETLQKVKPDILLACFGCPKQEKWVSEHYRDCASGVTLCAGATVDFLAGNVKRAPKVFSENGLEWFYRFVKEPKRLFRRYFVDDMQIFCLAWKYRKEQQ